MQTEVTLPDTRPGGTLECRIEVIGGASRVEVQQIGLVLCAKVYGSYVDFQRCTAVTALTLNPGTRQAFDVTCDVPWESPLTLGGVEIGLRTELAVARAIDRSDLDEVQVSPAPAQRHILDCMAAMGFGMIGSSLEKGRLSGVPGELGFYQEIEFSPGTAYARQLNSLKLTFVHAPDRLHVVIELDRKVTFADRDVFGRFAVNPRKLDTIDWTSLIESWLAGLVR